MSLLGSLGNAAKGAIGTTVLGPVGALASVIDPTPGFSATNVIRTQANNLFGNNSTGNKQTSNKTSGSPKVLDANTSNPYTGGYGSASGGGGSSNAGSVADIAAYQDQINSLNQLLGNADVIQGNKTAAINQGFDNSLNQLTGNNQNVLNQYATQRTNTTNDYAKNNERINANARNGYNSLQRLLGGTGSAGDVLAPFAVSQQANSQRGQAADAFAKNLQGIDQGVAAANQNFNNQKKTLEGQRNSSLADLISSIDQQKIQYQQQLASAQNQLNIARGGSYATPTANNNAIAALIADQNSLGNRFAQPNFSVQDYVAPQLDLAAYQAEAAKLAGGNNDASTSPEDDTAAALAALLKQNQNNSAYSY